MWSFGISLGLSLLALSHPSAEKARQERSLQCSEQEACARLGACSPENPKASKGDLSCVPRSDAECTRSVDCLSGGACHYQARSKSCERSKTLACEQSSDCRLHGACVTEPLAHPDDLAVCQASPEGCRQSLRCSLWGGCELDPFHQVCVPTQASHCESSRGCEVYGLCDYEPSTPEQPGRCEGEAQARLRSRLCKEFGFCALHPRALKEAHCTQSRACTDLGWCAPLQEDASSEDSPWFCGATSCEASPLCREHGACVLHDNQCVVRVPQETSCTLVRVTPIKAEASSTRAPEGSVRFEASQAIDRDMRSLWVPASDALKGATLTLTLPKAEKVARVFIWPGAQGQDATQQWTSLFSRVVAVKVSAKDTHEIGYQGPTPEFSLWLSPIEVQLPPTETDTLTLEVLAWSSPLQEAAFALPEVLIEACR